MTVAELLHRIDSHELSEWMHYCTLEPFGDEQRPVATLTALTANVNQGKQGRTFKPDDFMPTAKRAAGRMSAQQMKMNMQAHAALRQAKLTRHGHHTRIS